MPAATWSVQAACGAGQQQGQHSVMAVPGASLGKLGAGCNRRCKLKMCMHAWIHDMAAIKPEQALTRRACMRVCAPGAMACCCCC